jgi:cell volume regulation protein A
MTISTELILLVGSVLFFISMLVGQAGHRFGVPILLLFLMVGMIFGSDGFGLKFENIQMAQAIGSVCLAIILFSGGLDTRISEIKPVIGPGVVLATLGVLMTAVFTGLFTYWMTDNFFPALGLGFLSCMLLASTVSSTDSASVFAILRSKGLTLKNNLRPLLELESGSNDPMAYLLTVMFIDIIQYGENPDYLRVGLSVLIQLVVGTAMGILLGRLAVKIINKVKMDNDSFYPIMLLVFGVFIFASTYFLEGNGYLAVYIAGLVIGNSRFAHKHQTLAVQAKCVSTCFKKPVCLKRIGQSPIRVLQLGNAIFKYDSIKAFRIQKQSRLLAFIPHFQYLIPASRKN